MPGSIQSIERAAAILQVVAEHPAELGLTEVAESLDLAKATTHGLLRTLLEVGFLAQDDGSGKYRLGGGLVELGRAQLDPNVLRSHAVNWCDSLAGRSGESVRVAALLRGRAEIVHHVFRPDDSQQTLEVGACVPAHATALGKVLLAWGPSARAREHSQLDPFTAHTVASGRDLLRHLVEVRRQGFAAEVQEHHEGQAAIAAPVRGAIGRVVGAIDIHGDVDRLCDVRGRPRAHLVAQVCEAARSVSRDLVTSRR